MIPVPNLDDRTFADLVAEARERVRRSSPDWTDLSVHDPGAALLEAFAYLTEVMLYRLNRLPEKAYLEFLNLLRVVRRPPAAAWVELTFSRTGADTAERIVIPAGTRVVAARGADPQPVVFTTTVPAAIAEGAAEARVRAYHCELVDGELLGLGSGLPGQVLRCDRAPLATTGEPLEVMLGVQAAGPVDGTAREFQGKVFEIWQRVESFAGLGPTDRAYLLDPAAGVVTFAPELDGAAVPGAVPGAHREIRIWYRTGGGSHGNVGANTLTTLRDPIAGVRVGNAEPARGGRDLEAVDAVARRGPYELFSLHRAVTARDFELLATTDSPAVARARAFTRAAMWSFARPGEVEVTLVPFVPEAARPGWRLPVSVLLERQLDEVRLRTQTDLDRRRALGTSVTTTWARYKTVAVRGRVVVGRQEDLDAVRRRIHDRLYQAISPLPAPATVEGWTFGEPLRASNVYRILEQAEPGVRYVDDVRFVLDHAPSGVTGSIAADNYQAATWYTGGGSQVFRSTNDGQGWELVSDLPGETVRQVLPAPGADRPGVTARPGTVAVVTNTDEGGSSVYVSADLGETWRKLTEIDAVVLEAAWIDRDEAVSLLLASDAGLFEMSLVDGAVPLQIVVDQKDQDRGFNSVRAFVSERGVWGVALAAETSYGVYLSTAGGKPGTFQHVGLAGTDTRALAVQLDGPDTVLWVGTGMADPRKPGKGCYRARLFEADVRWQEMSNGWTGGTCWGLDFTDGVAYAASQSGGVLQLDTTAAAPQWESPSVNCGLPLRDRTRFEPVRTVAAGGEVFVGGNRGVQVRAGAGLWRSAASTELRQVVTIPPTWLLVSGDHDIEVVTDDAA
ncbi:putative baseplate assembly protein [Catellatospora sp. KI3]|uniref:putative baseplate assembly protein n=1 Tax=Catellatospora sp. KI3 TaxID=3041620 RepID=UPI002482CDA6|nr:putative baseplate assembly protein [Catellatospora sp. KI3]MDI1463784.1 putative baseplate assembly protein [Catellatospora sp. KI3]